MHARAGRSLAIALLAIASMAHVGSPDTFFAGQAGPYPVRVSVRLPGVIPGLAQITVRVEGIPADAITRVTAQAIQWNLGVEGAPPPDVARPVPSDAGLYATELWLMSATSYRVHIVVEGRDGSGTAVVPVVALATVERPMSPGLGALLACLGVFLTAGLLTIIGAASSKFFAASTWPVSSSMTSACAERKLRSAPKPSVQAEASTAPAIRR